MANHALRRVLLAYLAFSAAVYGTWVAILLYAYSATGPGSVGVVALVQLLPAAVLAPVAAALADRYPRDRVLLAGYLLQALAYALLTAGMVSGAPPALVYAAGAALAIAVTFTRPAQGALLPALARTPEELTAANSVAGTAEGLGVLLGPLGAAALLAVGSSGTVLAAGTMAALVAAALVMRLPLAHPEQARPGSSSMGSGQHAGGHPHDGEPGAEAPIAESAWSLLVGGLRAIAVSGHTRVVVGLLGVRMLTSGAIDILFVLLALQVFGSGDTGAGILVAAMGLGLVLGGASSLGLIGRQRLAPALAMSALVWGIPLLIVGTVAPAWAAPLLVVVAGMGFAAIDVAGRTLLQRVTPDRQLARVLGALEGIGLVFLAAGSLLAPVLSGWLGPQGALGVVAILLPVAVLATWLPLRHMDSHAHVPVREMAVLGRNRIFAPLGGPQLEAVARHTRWLTLRPGEVVIREGDTGDRYYVLESGVMRVTVGGREVRVVDQPGDGVGEIALLRGVPRTATVTASQPCVLLALGRSDFLLAVTGNEAVRAEAHQAASDRDVASDRDAASDQDAASDRDGGPAEA